MRLELSQTSTRQPYIDDWWEQGDANRDRLEALIDSLLVEVKQRAAELRAEEETR